MNYFIVKRIFFIAILVFAFQQCAGKKTDLNPEASRGTIKGAPSWYLETGKKDGFKLVSASATSQDMQLAINKASVDAGNTLASMVKSEMNALVKRVREETGREDDSELLDQFSQVQEQVVATTLQDWSVSKKEVMREKNSKGKSQFQLDGPITKGTARTNPPQALRESVKTSAPTTATAKQNAMVR